MVVDRRHFEYPLAAGDAVINYLKHVGGTLDNINHACKQQYQRAAERISEGNDHTAEEHGACIAHKDLGGVFIPKEESHARTRKGRCRH